MNDELKSTLWRQFGASIDMFKTAVENCPDELWREPLWHDSSGDDSFSQLWYVAYHSLFWLDLYLSGAVEGFTPPPPFDLGELDPAGVLPGKVSTKEELLHYVAHCRAKCQQIIESLTDEQANRLCRFTWGEAPYLELLIYNMRHVQEHGAQISMMLGLRARQPARWVTKAKPSS